MKLKVAMILAALMLMVASAGAQTKISGTVQCAKPDPQSAMPIGDRAGHAFMVMKDKCTWSKAITLAGTQTKTAEDTAFAEADGSKSSDSGYDVTTMANGDQFVVRFSGNSTMGKDGALLTQAGTWSFVSGTGKLKGITGKGTYKGRSAANGGAITDVEGEYRIAGQ